MTYEPPTFFSMPFDSIELDLMDRFAEAAFCSLIESLDRTDTECGLQELERSDRIENVLIERGRIAPLKSGPSNFDSLLCKMRSNGPAHGVLEVEDEDKTLGVMQNGKQMITVPELIAEEAYTLAAAMVAQRRRARKEHAQPA